MHAAFPKRRGSRCVANPERLALAQLAGDGDGLLQNPDVGRLFLGG